MTDSQKVKYIQAYIHYFKDRRVEINQPRNGQESSQLHWMYLHALNKMNEIGKKITVK